MTKEEEEEEGEEEKEKARRKKRRKRQYSTVQYSEEDVPALIDCKRKLYRAIIAHRGSVVRGTVSEVSSLEVVEVVKVVEVGAVVKELPFELLAQLEALDLSMTALLLSCRDGRCGFTCTGMDVCRRASPATTGKALLLLLLLQLPPAPLLLLVVVA